jgi:hypothetical protein
LTCDKTDIGFAQLVKNFDCAGLMIVLGTQELNLIDVPADGRSEKYFSSCKYFLV